MTPREKLQLAYALDEQFDMALHLHLALPESGCASQRALERLAFYQAQSRAYRMPTCLRHIRHRLGRPPLAQVEVPGHLVRDIGLPPFAHQVRATRPGA